MRRITLLTLAVGALFVGGLREQFCTANVEGAAGSHGPGSVTRRADAALARTHLLVKKGSDAFHVAACGAADYPTGITHDQSEAAEDLINVAPLGSSTQGSRKVACGSALGDDIDLYTAANGLAQAEPGVAGTYYYIGRSTAAAQQDSAGNYTIEFAPRPPLRTVVAATPATVANIAAAMASPAAVKFL